MATKQRNINYIGKDFNSFRNNLIEYAKTYFPNTYNDFTDTSTGMMFIEMASYVGDVLSFYLDNQIQETFIQYARQTENLYSLAYLLGYTPKVTTAATTNIDFYQQLPAITSGSTVVPDFTYALKVATNTQITTNNNSNIPFLIQDAIDFSTSSSLDPTTISVYQIQGNKPTYYLLKKTRKAISATINSISFNFGSPVKFDTRNINASNIIGILDIVDSDGNVWYEVSNLAQESVYSNIKNTNTNDPNFSNYSQDAPYLLKINQVQRRFATRFLNSTTLQLQFGAGNTGDNDEEIVPNPDNVGIGLPFEKDKLTTAFSPLNFVFTNTYGIAPSNTTLTVRYLTGGTVSSNVASNTLTNLNTSGVSFLNSNIANSSLANTIFNSIACSNAYAADGGSDGDTIDELRQNALGNFQNQLRTVTTQDYLIRALSMPSNLGVVAKAFATPSSISTTISGESPAVIDLYVLSYDANKNLSIASNALKQNLKTYLSEYRMINDSIKIKDAYIINIGINFDIVVLPNYINNEVLTKCIKALVDHFNIDKWQINEPIMLNDLYILLDKIDGVQTVKNISFVNLTGSSLGYSDFAYDVQGANINGVIYPSVDPMIFEIKFPTQDIKGRVSPL
jgi:hypothetical protein